VSPPVTAPEPVEWSRDPAAAAKDPAGAARRRYFPAVEGMRGVAALLVFGGHFLVFSHSDGDTVWTAGLWFARLGVVVFFGISGFLLYRPFVAARHSSRTVVAMTPSFLWRRAARILPAYWVALSLALVWPALEMSFAGPWWAYYGLLQIYDLGWLSGGLPTAWSLCVEATFYLALPLLAGVLAHRGVGSGNRHGLRWELAVLSSLGLASLVVYGPLIDSPGASFLTMTLLSTFSWFAWGMLLAVIQIERPRATSRLGHLLSLPHVCWPLGAAVFALAALEVSRHLGVGYGLREGIPVLLLGLAAMLLLAPTMLGDGQRTVRLVLANRAMVFAGTISYGIYLYHYPFVRSLLNADFVLESGHPVLYAGLLAVVGTFAFASASWYLVERPLMRRARGGLAIVGRRRRGAPAGTGGD
jgi:peptidoglycan/LPS O-acetylase OafA/YrhL